MCSTKSIYIVNSVKKKKRKQIAVNKGTFSGYLKHKIFGEITT